MNKYWDPAQFGKIPEGWVKAYTVAVGNLPLVPNKELKKWIGDLKKHDGFIGIRPEYPNGTLLLFDTENHAKVARNLISIVTKVGDNIGVCYIPPEFAGGKK